MSSTRYQSRPAALATSSSKLRRRTTADSAATAAATRDSSLWATLHEDMVGQIAWRVLDGDLRDYVRFRAVCANWRSSTACPRGRGIVDRRFHPRRWMVLPEGHGLHPGHGKLCGFVRFFNLSTGAFVRVHLPHFKDHCILDSIDGILLLQRDHDTAVRRSASSTSENDDEPNGEGPQPNSGTEVPQPPIEDETTADEEGDGEVRANLEALDHDHGKRIPISRYDVNDQNKVAGDILRRVQFNQRIMILNT
ncbi:hypothetical protein HU200_061730 [Digitaria exilis]|uniref:F-box protein n=1 Tax=Digitaria exilis TaxID=1010633 RepID=A0A835AEP8_9POAL|nr:hypothetical protein HU200_061730 [Digitaria exilis]